MPVSRCTARPRNRRGGAGVLPATQGAGRFSPSSRSRPERAGRRWTSSLRCSFRGGPEGPKLAGAVRVLLVSRRERGGSAPVPGRDRSELGGGGLRHCGVPSEAGTEGPKLAGAVRVLLVHAGAGRFSPSSRSRPERAGRRWTSSLRCSFRGGPEGPKLAGAVRVLLVHAGSGEVQPQFQVATGANWAAVDFVIAMFLPRRARGPEAGGGGAGAAGLTQERGGSAPVPGRDRSELGGGGLRHCGVPSEAGTEGPKLAGAVRVLLVHAGAGRFSPSSRSRPERAGRRWTSSLRCSFRGGHRGPKAGGGGAGAAGVTQGSGEVQPQFQVATGASWLGAAVHCWVASWASIDSMALTIVFMGRFLSHKVFDAQRSWALAGRRGGRRHICRFTRFASLVPFADPPLGFATSAMVKPPCCLQRNGTIRACLLPVLCRWLVLDTAHRGGGTPARAGPPDRLCENTGDRPLGNPL